MQQGKEMGKRNKKKSELVARYKSAFDEIIGDPYAYPAPIDGHYSMLKSRSSISSVKHKQNSAPGPVNRARPNPLDFFCDVDRAIKDALATFKPNQYEDGAFTLDEIFYNTYFTENGLIFMQAERSVIEQLVGRILVARKISPVSKYFTVTKQ
jgi:hypothetical protein